LRRSCERRAFSIFQGLRPNVLKFLAVASVFAAPEQAALVFCRVLLELLPPLHGSDWVSPPFAEVVPLPQMPQRRTATEPPRSRDLRGRLGGFHSLRAARVSSWPSSMKGTIDQRAEGPLILGDTWGYSSCHAIPSYAYGCGPCCEWSSQHSSLLGRMAEAMGHVLHFSFMVS
jgi:hypothetical protein